MKYIIKIMPTKRSFAITVLETDRIADINSILRKRAEITMQSSSHIYFDTQPANPDDIVQDITFFMLESDEKKSADEKLNDLIYELDQQNTDYAIRDEDTGKMIVYVEFVGALDIKFDNLKSVKAGTYEKIDELKSYKTESGLCKGYKPNFRPMESQSIENKSIKPESIYLFCHSQEDLMQLKGTISKKVLEIDPDLKLEFRQFTGEDPEYRTKNPSP